MTRQRCERLGLLAFIALISCASCGTDPRGQPASHARAGPRSGVTDAEPGAGDNATVRQTVLVPVYPFVYTEDQARPINLAITVYVRNSDRSSPILLTGVRYHGSDGRIVHDYLAKPLRIAPMAATEFFVKQSEVAAGASASFFVDWSADTAVSAPAIEAVMIGTQMNQGIAFTSHGRVVTEPVK